MIALWRVVSVSALHQGESAISLHPPLSTPPHLPLWLITKPRAEPTVLFSSFPPAIHCAGGGLNMSVRSCRRRLCCL